MKVTELQSACYCTTMVTCAVSVVEPSVADTVTVYPEVGGTVTAFGTVVGLILNVVDPTLVGSAWDVAVTVTPDGRPGATVGAVYRPVELIEPHGLGVPAQDDELLKVQLTFWLLVLVSVAVNCSVWFGQLSVA